jgi:uncharacterized SAM-binding protein YcdF (DUF218 family)
MIYVHKILPLFLLPVGITLLLVSAGLLLKRKALIWAGVAVLWLGSTPVVGNFAMQAAEGWAVRDLAVNAPKADAIVVLSGGRIMTPGDAGVSEWLDADRFFGGVELHKAGKAPLLVFTGGWAPWQPDASLEGDVLIQYAREMGIPGDQLVTTGKVVNTAEEARAVAALLKHRQENKAVKPRILLVTSAFHMRRARLLFERAELETVPFPVDFQVSARERIVLLHFLPNADSLKRTEAALREVYGLVFYLAARG